MHYLMLNLVRPTYVPTVNSVMGIILVLMNYLATLALSVFVIQMIGNNSILKRIIFGK